MWEFTLQAQVWFLFCFGLLILGVVTLLAVLWAYNLWRPKPPEAGDKVDKPDDPDLGW